MWWRNVRRFWLIPITGFVLLQTACGFHSIYGTHSYNAPVAEQMNQIAIDNIPDRQGQMLRNDLIDKLYIKGRPSQPLYKLTVTLHGGISDLGVQANATSSRSLMDTFGDYTLRDMKDKVLVQGTAHSIASFNKLDQQYGTLASQKDATQRTINEVSEQIVNRLSLYFGELGDQTH